MLPPPLPETARTLPIFERLDDLMASWARSPVLGLEAETGAGKSTLVPWRLLAEPALAGRRTYLVQPRTLAAIAVAERVAALVGEPPGVTVGYRTREATRVGPSTRLEVVTWGVFLRVLQDAPELDGVGAVLLDEFHERHWQGDLCWAFLREVREVLRPELRVMLLSTDLPGSLRTEVPVVRVPGRQFPVDVTHAPRPEREPLEKTVAAAVRGCLGQLAHEPAGACVLAFLPGKAEIERTLRELAPLEREGVDLFALHRAADAATRAAVFAPLKPGSRRVVAATNIAETSLTLPDVRAVVDAGLERRFVYSPRTGLSHMETVRISRLSATQRSGRAGRTAPGVAVRLWPVAERLEDFADPELLRADPLPLALELALWAGDAASLRFLTPPPPAALQVAAALLRDLGLLDAGTPGRITDRGRRAARLGVHPRLAAMLLGASPPARSTAVLLAALLEEDLWTTRDPERVSLWVRLLVEGARPPDRLRRAVDRIAGALGHRFREDDADPVACARLLAAAYPDRVGRVDPANPKRLVLVSGRAGLLPEPLEPGSLAVAVFADGGDASAKISLFEPVTLSEVLATGTLRPVTRTMVDFEGWAVTGRTRVTLGAVVLDEKIAAPDRATLQEAVAARLAVPGARDLLTGSEGLLAGPKVSAVRLRLRLAAAAEPRAGFPDDDDDTLAAAAGTWLVPHVRFVQGPVVDDALVAHALLARLPGHLAARLRDLCPDHLTLPSGRRVRVDYEAGPRPVIASKLQDFFGCRETPRVAGQPVLIHLLSPAGRPVQITADLAGFWKTSYPLVRKELAGRYPKHKWPQDP